MVRRFISAIMGVAVFTAGLIAGTPPATAAHGLLAHGSLVGDPREDVGPIVDAGVVYVFPPAEDGLLDRTGDGSIAITEASFGVTPQAGDLFGASVLQADTNGDGFNDLIIGAPGRDHGAGVVYVIRSNSAGTGFDLTHVVVLQQGTDGISGSSTAGDDFGASLVAGTPYKNVPWFAIGVPGKTIGSATGAGEVVIMALNLDVTQTVVAYPGHDAPGTPQSGDHFGQSMAQLAVRARGRGTGPQRRQRNGGRTSRHTRPGPHG